MASVHHLLCMFLLGATHQYGDTQGFEPTTAHPLTVSSPECKNYNKDCYRFVASRGCSIHKDYMKRHCPLACGFCKGDDQTKGGSNMADVTARQCAAVIMGALEKSRELGTKMNIAVVDEGGNLKAFTREDGAWLGSIDISIKKAKTSRFFDMETQELGKLSQPGNDLYGIEHSNQGLITFPGGVPLKVGDTIVGAVGVSGSSVKNDKEVAEAGAINLNNFMLSDPVLTTSASEREAITAKQCADVIEAALQKSKELGTRMNIAVVDAGGNLKAFRREDNAWLGSIDISIKKARTTRYFDMETQVLGSLSQPGKDLYGIEHSNQGLITFPGGVPLKIGNKIVGAVGVSGSSVKNDKEVAEAGARAMDDGEEPM